MTTGGLSDVIIVCHKDVKEESFWKINIEDGILFALESLWSISVYVPSCLTEISSVYLL